MRRGILALKVAFFLPIAQQAEVHEAKLTQYASHLGYSEEYSKSRPDPLVMSVDENLASHSKLSYRASDRSCRSSDPML